MCHLFGVGPETEAEYIAALGTNPSGGTRVNDIVRFLNECGLRTTATGGMSVADLADATRRGSPVICPVKRGGAGHYVVVCEADGTAVQIHDPIDGPTTRGAAEFVRDWHDEDAGGNRYDRFGIVVSRRGVKSLDVLNDFPPADPFAEILRRFFEKLRDHVLDLTKHTTGIETKAFFPVTDWADALAAELLPVIRFALGEGASGIMGQIGGDTLPVLPVLALEQAAKEAARKLAESTLATTNLDLEAAHQAVRDAIAAGLAGGEANAQLTERIQAIFTELTEQRAYLIAETESAAAKHGGELIAIREAGVECKKVWLCDNMACEKCRPLDGQVRELDEPFVTLPGGGAYSRVFSPPAHPLCRCTLQYVFKDDESSASSTGV